MLKCLIVDDEMPAREELKYQLEDFSNIDIVDMAKNGLEAIEMNNKYKPDIIFLDIQMPKINGIDVAEKILISAHTPLIVFVTAYDDFAIKAFEVNAIDYLLKPVLKDRLTQALNKVEKVLGNEKEYEGKLKKLLGDLKLNKEQGVNKICSYKNETLVPIDPEDIIYATIENRNTIIITKEERYVYSEPLSNLEKKLQKNNFFRSHRSFLINLDYIEAIEPWFNSTYQIQMKNIKEKMPVSRSQVKEFKMIMDIN
ncbi:MAG: response regulator transcription factor [Firmicutes bacterium]|nr:response regulator transcription factor [Bacillota bacterium]